MIKAWKKCHDEPEYDIAFAQIKVIISWLGCHEEPEYDIAFAHLLNKFHFQRLIVLYIEFKVVG